MMRDNSGWRRRQAACLLLLVGVLVREALVQEGQERRHVELCRLVMRVDAARLQRRAFAPPASGSMVGKSSTAPIAATNSAPLCSSSSSAPRLAFLSSPPCIGGGPNALLCAGGDEPEAATTVRSPSSSSGRLQHSSTARQTTASTQRVDGTPLRRRRRLASEPARPSLFSFSQPSVPLLQEGARSSAEAQKEDFAVVREKHLSEWTVPRTMFQTLHMATAEEMERDSDVCVIGEDVGHYGGSYKVTKDLHYRFGNLRVMDTPICENTFTGMAIGAAMNGLRPIVEGMNMGFLLLAFNQISNNAGMVQYTSGGNFKVPLVIRGPGGIGKQLGPEHSQRIEAYLQAVPGLKMVACSTPKNARGLLKAAIRDDNPVVFFEHVLLYNLKEDVPLLPYTQPIDKAEIVRPGKDLTILAYSRMRHVAAEAAGRLMKMGISAEVIDLISLKPLDLTTIYQSLRKTHQCLILDESSKTGGIGGEVLAQVVENCSHVLDDIPVRLCSKDTPTAYNRLLEEAIVVSWEDVINAVLWMQAGRTGKNLEALVQQKESVPMGAAKAAGATLRRST